MDAAVMDPLLTPEDLDLAEMGPGRNFFDMPAIDGASSRTINGHRFIIGKAATPWDGDPRLLEMALDHYAEHHIPPRACGIYIHDQRLRSSRPGDGSPCKWIEMNVWVAQKDGRAHARRNSKWMFYIQDGRICNCHCCKITDSGVYQCRTFITERDCRPKRRQGAARG